MAGLDLENDGLVSKILEELSESPSSVAELTRSIEDDSFAELTGAVRKRVLALVKKGVLKKKGSGRGSRVIYYRSDIEYGPLDLYDPLTGEIAETLGDEPLPTQQIIGNVLQEHPGIDKKQVLTRLKWLVDDGIAGQFGGGKRVPNYFYLTSEDYGPLNHMIEWELPQEAIKPVLQRLDDGPVCLAEVRYHCAGSVRKAAEAAVGAGHLKRIVFPPGKAPLSRETVFYALEEHTSEQLEESIRRLECSRITAAQEALSLSSSGPFTAKELRKSAGIARPTADKTTSKLVALGLLELHTVANKRIYSAPGTPELDVKRFAARTYCQNADEIISLSASGPFLVEEVSEFIDTTHALQDCMRLEQNYGVIESVLVYGGGTHLRVYFRQGESKQVVDDFISRKGFRTYSLGDWVKKKIENREPFSLWELRRESGATKASTWKEMLPFYPRLERRLSPFVFFVPPETPESRVESYVERMSDVRSQVDSLEGYMARVQSDGDVFTLQELEEDFSPRAIDAAMATAISSGALQKTDWLETEDLYVPSGFDVRKLNEKMNERSLDFSLPWKLNAHYVSGTSPKELAGEFNVPADYVQSVVSNKTPVLLDTNGITILASRFEDVLDSLGVSHTRYVSDFAPIAGNYILAALPQGAAPEKIFSSIPGYSRRLADLSVLKESYREKFDLVVAAIDTLN